MFRRFLIGMLVFLATGPLYGQEVKLQWKFKEGEKFWIEEELKSKNTTSIVKVSPPETIEETSTQILSYTVSKVTSEAITLDMKLESFTILSPAGVKDERNNVWDKSLDMGLTITLAPDGKLMKVQGFDSLLKGLSKGEVEVAKMLASFFEESWTKTIEQTFGFASDKAVRKGDSWTRNTMTPGGPLGDFKTTNTYTYNGKSAVGEEIEYKQAMQYVLPKGDFGGLFKVTKGELKAEVSKGTIVFDAEKGRMVSGTSQMLLRGKITIDFAGQATEMDISTESNGTSRVHEKNPAKK